MVNDKDTSKLLRLAGRMSDLIRPLIGGVGVYGVVSEASVIEAADILKALRPIVDEYDLTIIELADRISDTGE